jgi:hypothetical protein
MKVDSAGSTDIYEVRVNSIFERSVVVRACLRALYIYFLY